MRFADFLKHAGKGIPEAAQELKVTVEAVRFWTKALKIPSEDNMVEIYKWSKGMVQPNDFYDLPAENARANGHDLQPAMNGVAA